MLYRSFVDPRWRQVGTWCVLGCIALTFSGCAAQVQQQQEDGRDEPSKLAIPCVKLPLFTLPLTNRPCSNNLLESLVPEAEPGAPSRNW